MTVHFIGAGPGAPDLITLRGRDLIARCPVCLYAGSLVPKELLAHCPPGARIVDTAPMTLDEIAAEFARRRRRGPRRRAAAFRRSLGLERDGRADCAGSTRLGIAYTMTPGVPAFAAAAAALRRELTLPEVAQSLVLTRTSGRASAHARDGKACRLRRDRRDAGDPSLHPCAGASRRGTDCRSTAPDCPVAVVYRAQLAGRARSFAARWRRSRAQARAAPMERTALILVGPALGAEDFRDSALYDADYDRRFRHARRRRDRLSAPGLVIAAVRSGSGKTTVDAGAHARAARGAACASALRNAGRITSTRRFTPRATGRASLNLDSWAMEEGLVAGLAALAGAEADIVIAEGAMGLFDGVPAAPGRTGASADIAAATDGRSCWFIDVSGQGQTAAAIVRGVAAHDPRVKIAGVVLNKVGSERHRRLAAEAIEALGLQVFGALPREAGIALPERHLGLVQAGDGGPRQDTGRPRRARGGSCRS